MIVTFKEQFDRGGFNGVYEDDTFCCVYQNKFFNELL